MACCSANSGPRKVPALAVRSGGAVGCSRCGLSNKVEKRKERRKCFWLAAKLQERICLRNESIKRERI